MTFNFTLALSLEPFEASTCFSGHLRVVRSLKCKEAHHDIAHSSKTIFEVGVVSRRNDTSKACGEYNRSIGAWLLGYSESNKIR